MAYFISFIFFTGLIIAAALAKKNSPRWKAKLMLITGIISFISYFIIAISIQNITMGESISS